MTRRSEVVAWSLVMIAMLPGSAFLWFVGGVGACGEDAGDSPPESLGDQLCTTFVEPVAPWASLAATPLALGLVAGLVAIARRHRLLLVFATIAPPFLLVLGVFALLAAF
ncbi:MAG TPA: hypothetical protein VGJ34_07500 [Gaiellaceae bacterium]|jgi:hypothetical protein